MRTTIDFPDELLAQAKSKAALSHITLWEFFVDAVKQKLDPPAKTRRPIPVIEEPRGSAFSRPSNLMKQCLVDVDVVLALLADGHDHHR